MTQISVPSYISGIAIAYYIICKRKLWLFLHKIQMETDHENVKIGKQLQEEAFKREKKDITLENTINIDFVRKGNEIVVHEIKKSKKMEKAHKYQLLYYLYFLKKRGIEARGELNYVLLKQRVPVVLTCENQKEIEKMIGEIKNLICGSLPPVKRKKYCRSCAYFEFCFVGEE